MRSLILNLSTLLTFTVRKREQGTASRQFDRCEILESRTLLSAWDADWTYGPPAGSQPPQTYVFEKFPGSVLIEIPNSSTVEATTTENGNHLKGTVHSNGVDGKFKFTGHFQDNATPHGSDTFTGKLKVKIDQPSGKPVKLNINVVGQHPEG